jgi:hypothetical protein
MSSSPPQNAGATCPTEEVPFFRRLLEITDRLQQAATLDFTHEITAREEALTFSLLSDVKVRYRLSRVRATGHTAMAEARTGADIDLWCRVGDDVERYAIQFKRLHPVDRGRLENRGPDGLRKTYKQLLKGYLEADQQLHLLERYASEADALPVVGLYNPVLSRARRHQAAPLAEFLAKAGCSHPTKRSSLYGVTLAPLHVIERAFQGANQPSFEELNEVTATLPLACALSCSIGRQRMTRLRNNSSPLRGTAISWRSDPLEAFRAAESLPPVLTLDHHSIKIFLTASGLYPNYVLALDSDRTSADSPTR